MPRATPWGTVHLKRVGSQVTICGRRTLGWHAFWDLSFSGRSPDACQACARVAAGLQPVDAGPAPESSGVAR